ncbi:MAG: YCF48-related protein [Pseudomonadota bacterium]
MLHIKTSAGTGASRPRAIAIVPALFSAACMLLSCAAQAGFQDPLDHPALQASRLSERPLHAVAQAGTALVAVGPRGLIAVSTDHGATWRQSACPVQSDLVAVHFPTPAKGWAVGHDGVVLHSADGGKTWIKQLDGRIAASLFARYYQNGPEAGGTRYKAAQAAIAKNYKAGAALPLLDVWFEDEQHGFAVGAFGLIAATADGGRNWEPWLDRIDNPDLLSLNAIRGGDGGLYAAGERGAIFRLDRAKGRFEHIATGYEGSFFGLAVGGSAVLAYGLRGAVYRSPDRGQSWSAMPAQSNATISAGVVLAGSQRFVLATNGGELLVSDAAGAGFTAQKQKQAKRYTGLVALDGGKLLLTALEGMQVEALK